MIEFVIFSLEPTNKYNFITGYLNLYHYGNEEIQRFIAGSRLIRPTDQWTTHN